MWLLGVTGIFPSGGTYAVAFGVWTAATEVIPYVGPFIGAIPPITVAATQSFSAVVAVVLVYLFIHQIEGHIVIPKLMGGAVRCIRWWSSSPCSPARSCTGFPAF